MKRLFLLLAVCFAVASCNSGDEDKSGDDLLFRGNVTVTDAEGNIVQAEGNTDAELTVEGKPHAELLLFGVKIAGETPPVDLLLPEICYTAGEGWLILRDDDLQIFGPDGDPLAGYRARDLYGELYNAELTLMFRCGDFRISFRGYRLSH